MAESRCVQCLVDPSYKVSFVQGVDSLTTIASMAQDEINWAKKNGICNNYPEPQQCPITKLIQNTK